MSTAEDQQPPRFLTIGYALAPKKQQSFIQPSLLAVAAAHGLRLVPIDPTLPLSSQGPFHLILHKLSSPQWTSDLALFSALHPFVPIIDAPDAIEVTHDRVSMLKVVHDLAAATQGHHCTFGVPSQVVVHEPSELADAGVVAGLRFPVIAKPLVADGSARSHEMALVFNRDGLLKQKPPLVLQEFVNHGGVIFKVYVVGDYVKCVKRKSLPDISDEKLSECSEGSLPFSQISNLTAPERAKEYHETEQLAEAEMPLTSFVTELANGLRHAMGLHLFNFDMIRDVRVGNHYLVIDINYFPGYAKMPSYETVLTDFFLSIIREKQKEDGSDSVLGAVDDRGKCCIREDIDNVG